MRSPWLARHGHEARFGIVLELAVAPARPDEPPAVGIDEAKQVADVHPGVYRAKGRTHRRARPFASILSLRLARRGRLRHDFPQHGDVLALRDEGVDGAHGNRGG
jgi:hypothetical protein